MKEPSHDAHTPYSLFLGARYSFRFYRRSALTPAPLPSGEGRLELALLLGEKGKG